MVLGLSLATFTLLHVALSLVGIATGFVVLAGMLASRLEPAWTATFLATTLLTSLTGFLFPFERLLPSHVVGVISTVVLGAALAALYGGRLVGAWRWIYAASAMAALYLNVFVGVVQAFVRIPALQTLAPTQSEPPFVVAQTVVLLAFAVLGGFAVRRFHAPLAVDMAVGRTR